MGMEMQKRILNYRPSWNLQVDQPVSGNYYPVQSTIYIEDVESNESLAILPDRAQGGSSINEGEIELMLHRRLLFDDQKGVYEALNELDPDLKGMRQWVTHTLLFNKPGVLETSYRQVQLNNYMSNIVLLTPVDDTPSFEESEDTLDSGNFRDFDQSIKLLSRPITSTKFLFRFQNMDETDTKYVDTAVFTSPNYGQGSVVEMSLTANQPKTEMINKRFNWNGLELNNPDFAKTDYLTSNQFMLRPLEIRTFMVEFSSSDKQEIIQI